MCELKIVKSDLHSVYPDIILSPLQHTGRTTACLLFKKSLNSNLAGSKEMEKNKKQKAA